VEGKPGVDGVGIVEDDGQKDDQKESKKGIIKGQLDKCLWRTRCHQTSLRVG